MVWVCHFKAAFDQISLVNLLGSVKILHVSMQDLTKVHNLVAS